MQAATVAEAALEYFARGWLVFPVRGKRHPLVEWGKLREERPTVQQVAAQFSQHPDAGVAVALGRASGVVRVDAEGPVPIEVTGPSHFKSPSGGDGWLFAYDGEPTEVLWKGEGQHQELRIQSDGAYTVLPPSLGYQWVSDGELVPLPRALADALLSKRAGRELAKLEAELAPTVCIPDKDLVLQALKALDPVRADQRDCWLQVGMSLHAAGDAYLTDWVEWSKQSDKFCEGECEQLWEKFHRNGRVTVRTLLFLAREDGWHSPRLHEPLTDVGNGRVLAKAVKGSLLYVRAWSEWLSWDGARWRPGAEFEVVKEAKRVVRERYNRALLSILKLKDYEGEAKKDRVKGLNAVFKWCTSSEAAKKIHAAVDMARSEPGLLVEHAALDRYPELLCCPNGAVDLATGELLPNEPDRRITQLCPTMYSTEALAPRWEQFVREVFVHEPLVLWVQKLLGYCTTGLVREHVLPIFYGEGRNGKSTLIKAVMSVLGGDYSSTAPSGYLAATRGERHPTGLAMLYGKRLVADVETGDGMKLNEELVKRLTGGDEIVARRMQEDFWTFAPTHKLVVATNHEPRVRGMDTAIWARLKLVPFSVSFQGREELDLDSKLAQESQGILAWLVRGAVRWRAEGLGDDPNVKLATDTYRSDQDSAALFFRDRVEKQAGSRLRRSDAASAYKAWCAANGCDAVPPKAFAAVMARMGVPTDAGGKYYEGIRIA